MYIIITLEVRKTQTFTKYHQLFVSKFVHRIYLHLLYLQKSREKAMPLEVVKIWREKFKLKHEGYLYCLESKYDDFKKPADATKDSAKPLQQSSRAMFSRQENTCTNQIRSTRSN